MTLSLLCCLGWVEVVNVIDILMLPFSARGTQQLLLSMTDIVLVVPCDILGNHTIIIMHMYIVNVTDRNVYKGHFWLYVRNQGIYNMLI